METDKPSGNKLHLAISTHDIEATVEDYSKRVGARPCLHIAGEYALWRTALLNLSVRKTTDTPSGVVRHLGWEVPDTAPNSDVFTCETDVNGLVWERFTAQQQADEINDIWVDEHYQPNQSNK